MRKILFVFGTRPEAIKLAPVIKELENPSEKFEVFTCVTAQHREMLDQILELFEIKPNYDMDIMIENQSLFDVTVRTLQGIENTLKKVSPDLVVVQGDTTTTFVASLASFYLKIPVAHVEAGLRTNDKNNPFPEEVNRRLTSQLTDIHFAPTERAKQNLLFEGTSEDKIFVTGNTVIDALLITIEKVKNKRASDFESLQPIVSEIDNNCRIILVTAHRRENFGDRFTGICWALRDIAEKNKDVIIIYPVHMNPNVREPVDKILTSTGQGNILLIEPLDYKSFVWLMNKAYLILTDSGGIQEEAPSLGKPVLVLRDVTERPEGAEAGTVRVVGTDRKKIVNETQLLLDNNEEYEKMARAVNPYGDGKASVRIKEVLKSFG